MNKIKKLLKEQEEKVRLYLVMILILVIIFIIGYQCPFQLILGISCPGCGMTRSFLRLAHLDLSGAFYYHPLFWIIPLFVLAWIFQKKIPKKIIHLMIVIVCILFFGVYLYRMIYGDGQVVYIDVESSVLGDILKIFKM